MTRDYAGVVAAPGIGIGSIFVYHAPDGNIDAQIPQSATAQTAEHPPTDPDLEWRRFLDAQTAVEAELENPGHALNAVAQDIFAVHQLILQDPTLVDAVHTAIYTRRANAASATYEAVRDIADVFTELDDEYFASRASDIRDIGRRLLIKLGANLPAAPLVDLPEGSILVALDLRPSDVTGLADANVVGIALAESTPTAHSSILARSLGLPLICGLGTGILDLQQGSAAILDGSRGLLLVGPEEDERRRYSEHLYDLARQRQLAYDHAHEQAITKDGIHVRVYANVNQPDDAEQVRHIGADGIGLLRTEYLFRNRSSPPPLDEQTRIYSRIGQPLGGKLLTVRALDAGGDKPVDYVRLAHEENPFLGKRGIRLLLANPELLAVQYRALLKSTDDLATNTRVRFMLPMISTLSEVIRAKEIIESVEQEYIDHLYPHRRIELGVLIEVPSAAVIAGHIAEHVDFFSIGTNDLAQYVLASDRTNSHVAQLADPLHPSVLFMIRHVCLAALERNLPVSLCGEMAGNVRAVPLLLGLGVTEFSAPLPAIPMVKQIIREWDLEKCQEVAERALRCHGTDSVRELLSATIR